HRTRVGTTTATLGNPKPTNTPPPGRSHGRLSEAQRQAAGIQQSLIRVAVGLDAVVDLQADLARGLGTLGA
ncbi:MAG: PLP-dependent transferase, partial [Burkholderiaceae bacterium]|nr:PLP-dependent transferase [Burkholderiaceae bacterium]